MIIKCTITKAFWDTKSKQADGKLFLKKIEKHFAKNKKS